VKKTLGSYLVEALEAYGVRHVFGIPGVHNLELYRGLRGSRIQHVAGRHEQGLGFMADGYARVSGRVGVCFTISGPGLTNIATAMGQAFADSIPLLVIASEIATHEVGRERGCLHSLRDQLGIAQRVSGMAERITKPDELLEALSRVFDHAACGRPRPAYLGIPCDLLALAVDDLPAPVARPSPAPPTASRELVAEAIRRLVAAEEPLVLAGGGARGAATELRMLVEKIGAPLVMTINGRGLLPPDHPLAVSVSPSTRFVREAIARADVVLAVGTELGPTDYDMFGIGDLAPPSSFIRVDIDATQLEHHAPPAICLHADATQALRAFLEQGLGSDAGRAERGARRAAAIREESNAAAPASVRRQLAFLEMIRDRAPGAIIVGDSTQLVYTGNIAFAAATPGSWFNSATGYGTLGYALPAATGAALAAPSRPVICLIGDGGIQFSLGELGVPRDVDAWLAIVVWNNAGYGEIKEAMRQAEIDPAGVDFKSPDFALLASAYGYEHRLIDDLVALDRALQDFATRRQIIVLEVQAERFEASSLSVEA
jgi:acetolactate synthase I/II/III large subunit